VVVADTKDTWREDQGPGGRVVPDNQSIALAPIRICCRRFPFGTSRFLYNLAVGRPTSRNETQHMDQLAGNVFCGTTFAGTTVLGRQGGPQEKVCRTTSTSRLGRSVLGAGLLTAFIKFFGVVLSSTKTGAGIPAFAVSHGRPGSACHAAWPKLNNSTKSSKDNGINRPCKGRANFPRPAYGQ